VGQGRRHEARGCQEEASSQVIHSVAFQVFAGKTVELEEHTVGGSITYRLRVDRAADTQDFDTYELGFAAFCLACDEAAWDQLSIFSKEVGSP